MVSIWALWLTGRKKHNINLNHYFRYYCCYSSSSQVWRLTAGSFQQFEEYLMKCREHNGLWRTVRRPSGVKGYMWLLSQIGLLLCRPSCPVALFLALSTGCCAEMRAACWRTAVLLRGDFYPGHKFGQKLQGEMKSAGGERESCVIFTVFTTHRKRKNKPGGLRFTEWLHTGEGVMETESEREQTGVRCRCL